MCRWIPQSKFGIAVSLMAAVIVALLHGELTHGQDRAAQRRALAESVLAPASVTGTRLKITSQPGRPAPKPKDHMTLAGRIGGGMSQIETYWYRVTAIPGDATGGALRIESFKDGYATVQWVNIRVTETGQMVVQQGIRGR